MAETNYHVPNLDRALDIMELLSGHPDGLTRAEITAKTGLSANMVYRISMTLAERGYLQREEADKRYRLTRKLLSIGQESFDDHSLAERAWDDMVSLRDSLRETIQLGVLVENEGVVIERVSGTHPVCMMVHLGTRFPLHNTAPGKILFAGLAAAARRRMLKTMRFAAATERSITSPARFMEEIAKVEEQGYALDLNEVMDGVSCLAAPVRNAAGETVAELVLSGPSGRLPEAELHRMAPEVVAAANNVSRRLGWRP
jgi:DNA-binding IclR family transcriptional regulator